MSWQPKQAEFVKKIGLFIIFTYEQGYELTFGDGYRDPRVFGEIGIKMGYGHINSYHKKRLAHDFNIFKNKVRLTEIGEILPLGEFWESLGGTWGGRFGDAEHFSWGE